MNNPVKTTGHDAEPANSPCGCATGTDSDPSCGAASSAESSGTPDGRRATAVDPAIKKRNLARLRRIEGQVRGLQKMVDEERWCADVLTQVASVQEALRGVSRELLRNHLTHCAAQAAQGDPASADAVYDELVALLFKYNR